MDEQRLGGGLDGEVVVQQRAQRVQQVGVPSGVVLEQRRDAAPRDVGERSPALALEQAEPAAQLLEQHEALRVDAPLRGAQGIDGLLQCLGAGAGAAMRADMPTASCSRYGSPAANVLRPRARSRALAVTDRRVAVRQQHGEGRVLGPAEERDEAVPAERVHRLHQGVLELVGAPPPVRDAAEVAEGDAPRPVQVHPVLRDQRRQLLRGAGAGEEVAQQAAAEAPRGDDLVAALEQLQRDEALQEGERHVHELGAGAL